MPVGKWGQSITSVSVSQRKSNKLQFTYTNYDKYTPVPTALHLTLQLIHTKSHILVFWKSLLDFAWLSGLLKNKHSICCIHSTREYWMICRGFFLAVVWFGSSPNPSAVGKLDRRHTGSLRKRTTRWLWRGAKSYDGEKAWSSIYHSILSRLNRLILSS